MLNLFGLCLFTDSAHDCSFFCLGCIRHFRYERDICGPLAQYLECCRMPGLYSRHCHIDLCPGKISNEPFRQGINVDIYCHHCHPDHLSDCADDYVSLHDGILWRKLRLMPK